jgi:uncharacterized protein YutE (UPF0331/DUF86 family)
MSDSVAERTILENLLPNLEADGYQVFLRPTASIIPSFMKGYVPDAIALREDKKLAIEVMSRRSPGTTARLKRIGELFRGQESWDLCVYWIEDTANVKELPVAPIAAIKSTLSDARKLVDSGVPTAALLLAWAGLEALARTVMPERFKRPQTPGRVVEILSSEGYFTPTEADFLRELVRVRNAVIHGDIQQSLTQERVHRFLDIVESVLKA